MNEHTDKRWYHFFDRSMVSVLVGGLVVMTLLLASIFVYNLENPSIAERRVSQILETPNTFYGTTVSIEGEIENVLGTRALTIDGPGAIGDQLLVVSRDSLEPVGGSGIPQSIFSPTEVIMVEGQVREFNLNEVEQELGVDLDDQQFSAWEGRPFVYAFSVVPSEK